MSSGTLRSSTQLCNRAPGVTDVLGVSSWHNPNWWKGVRVWPHHVNRMGVTAEGRKGSRSRTPDPISLVASESGIYDKRNGEIDLSVHQTYP